MDDLEKIAQPIAQKLKQMTDAQILEKSAELIEKIQNKEFDKFWLVVWSEAVANHFLAKQPSRPISKQERQIDTILKAEMLRQNLELIQ